jgi:hypothetical protein
MRAAHAHHALVDVARAPRARPARWPPSPLWPRGQVRRSAPCACPPTPPRRGRDSAARPRSGRPPARASTRCRCPAPRSGCPASGSSRSLALAARGSWSRPQDLRAFRRARIDCSPPRLATAFGAWSHLQHHLLVVAQIHRRQLRILLPPLGDVRLVALVALQEPVFAK